MIQDGEPAPTPFAIAEQMVQEWGAINLQPIIAKTYARKMDEAQQLLARARIALLSADLPEDVQEALGYYLDFNQCRLDFTALQRVWTEEDYRRVRDRFSAPARTAYGNIERLRRLLAIRLVADSDGFEELTQAEIESFLDQLPVSQTEGEAWHLIAGWAFARQNLTLLERAFEVHLLNPSPMLGQAKWQRVNLMYLLVSGKATRLDVEESIKLLTIKPQLYEFQEQLWPACVRAGLADPMLEELLRARAEAIEELSPEPRAEQRTKTIRGGSLPSDD